MKLFRFGLNIWITIVSLLSFLAGWVALAHSPKPVSNTAPQPQVSLSGSPALPTLTPLPLNGSGGNFQNFQVAPSTSFSNNSNNGFFNSAPQPIFRTGGS